MDKRDEDTIIKAVCERGGQYVVDAQQRLVGVLISWEEYEHYLDLLDDEEDSQDGELAERLTRAASSSAPGERPSLRDYLEHRPPTHADLQG